MLNVSCQKQTHCGSLPARSPTERPMEFTGQQRTFGACNPLGVPALGPLEVDDDECEVVIGIRPKSSPLPRRRSSDSDEDWEAGPPPSGSRRVSFADAKGLSLVHVKEFDTWNVTKLPDYDSSEGRGSDAEVYFLSPLTFCLPSSTEELFARVREQKIELETIELLPGTTVLKGVIRVLNVSFSKAVYVRTTLDAWSSHFDLLAEYVPSSSDGATDRFSFKLAVVPPFGEPGARVDFCLRYETPSGTFWANNNDRNYVLFCQRRVGERKEMPLNERANNKSCLKTVGQSFSTGGNVAEMEASSTDDGAKVDSLKPEKTSNGPPAASEEDRQKLLAENRQNCSRRSGRKAARMARVRDYFSQRNVGVEDTKRDESPPEENQKAVQGETPRQKASDVQSLPEVSSESEGSHFVSESLETCSEPTVEVLHAASPPDTETENRHIARLPEEPAAAERQDNRESVSKADESSQRQSGKAEPEGSIESPDSRSNSFSFGTVVAPLYQQVFGRACHKSTWGNPVRATLHAGDSSYPHAASAQAGCTVRADAKGDEGKIQVIQSSNTECSVANRPPLGKDKTSSSVAANDIADHEQTLRDPGDVSHRDEIQTNTSEVPETISGDTTAHSHAANALKTDPPKPRKRAESSRPRGEAREDGGTRHAELPQRARARAKTAPHEATSAFRAPRPPELPRAPTSPTAACPQGGEASEALHASKPNDVRDSDTEETEIGCLSRLEKMEEKDTTENETSLEADGVEEEVAGVVINPAKEGTRLSAEREIGGGAEATTGDHTHGGALVQLQSEDARNVERRETDSKEQELCSADLAGVNRGTAVEEEEKNMLTDEEESLRTAGKERGPSEDAGRKTTAFEKRDTTETADEDVIFWEIKAARQKENKAQDADVAEGEEGGETRARKGREEAAKELKNTGAQEIKQEIKEKQEFDVERKNVQNKVTETHLSDGDQAGVGWEVRREEENPRHKVEIFVAETEGSEVTDAESEGATIEDGQSEESRSRATSDVTQNEVGAAPSALVNNVQDETVIDKENQHISTETQRCKESDCCFGEKAIIPEAVGAEEESAAPVLFAGEPENDPSGRESASAESDSDDEVELYMHCLRAVHAGGARADRNKDKSRPPASRGKLPPMPSISECQDEDRHRRDGEAAAAPEAADTKPSRWKETFSCGEISKILLLATLLAVFLVVAYRYDFLACLGLYLVSVVWLYCQGERQPKQQKNKTE